MSRAQRPPTPGRGARVRAWLGHHRRELLWRVQLTRLPPRVAIFQSRARRSAWRHRDRFSLTSSTRPRDLWTLLKLADGRDRVVELGTATGWTAITLALASEHRHVITYDPFERTEPARYLALVPPSVTARIEMVRAPGSSGPRPGQEVDLLYIDSTHERDDTIAEFVAWRPALRDGAIVVFDDYLHPDFPGVREAVASLDLPGHVSGTLFVHRHEAVMARSGARPGAVGPDR